MKLDELIDCPVRDGRLGPSHRNGKAFRKADIDRELRGDRDIRA